MKAGHDDWLLLAIVLGAMIAFGAYALSTLGFMPEETFLEMLGLV